MPRQKSQHVDDPVAVGERLKAERERAGLSQRQLSFSGCSPAYISRIEAGDRIPSLQLLRELGNRLGVTADYLATGSEYLSPEPSLVEAEIALRLGDVAHARRLYEEALERPSNTALHAAAHEGLGQIAFRAGDMRGTIEAFERSLALAKRTEPERPALAETLGRAYAALGEHARAADIYRRCLAAVEERGDSIQIVRFACLLGYALMDGGKLDQAEKAVARALAAGERLTDPTTRARLYFSQSKLLGESGEHDQAARYGQLALATLEMTEDAHFTGLAHQLVAHLELDRGRPEAALEHLRQGWALLEATGSPIEQAHFRIEEARALAHLGELERAGSVAMQVAGTLGEVLPEDAGRTYTVLGDVFRELGQPDRAQELYELAEEFLRPTGPSRYLADLYSKLASLHEEADRREVAYEYMKKALGMQGSVGANAHG